MAQEKTEALINAAVIALKADIDHLLKRVMGDNEKLLKENYELSKRIDELKKKMDSHVDPMMECCPHTSF